MTADYCDGFEHGVATLTANGGGLCAGVSGTVAVSSSNAHSGSYSLKVYPTAGTGYVQYALTSSTMCVYSFYLYVASKPTSNCELAQLLISAGNPLRFHYHQSTDKFAWYDGSSFTDLMSVSTGQHYLIDIRADCSANPNVWECTINTAAQTSINVSQAASTFVNVRLGTPSTTTCELYYDDLVYGRTSGDYPFGAGGTVGLSPNADGTHNAGTNTIEAQDGTDIGTTTAYDKINSVPIGNTTTYLRQATASTSSYAEVTFPDLSTDQSQGAIVCAVGTIAYTAATTSADQAGTGIMDGSTFREIWGNPTTRADYSDGSTASVYYRSARIAFSSLDSTSINAAKLRFGYSNDVSPNPYLIDAIMQVRYSRKLTMSAAQGSYTLTGQTTGTLWKRALSAVQGSYALTGQAVTLTKSGAAHDPLVAAQGSYALSGQTVGLLWKRAISAAQGSYALTGQAVGLLWKRALSAVQGSYALTGQAVGLLWKQVISIAQGSYALSGQAVGLLWKRALSAVQGSYALSGQAVGLLWKRAISAAQGSYALTGQAVGLLWKRILSAVYGAYILTGEAVTLTYTTATSYTLTTTTGTYSVSGQAVGLFANKKLSANSGTYDVSGQSISFLRALMLTLAYGSYDITGEAIGLTIARRLNAASGTYTLTGFDIDLDLSAAVPIIYGTITGTITIDRLQGSGAKDRLQGTTLDQISGVNS